MELKGIDAKLFTLEPRSSYSEKNEESLAKAAAKRAEKYIDDPASVRVALEDYILYRLQSSATREISVAAFPSTVCGRDEEQIYMLFLHLLRCYKKEKSLNKMPWAYPEVREKLRVSAQTVEDNRFVKCLVRLLKSLAIAAISAGVFLLLFWLLPKVEPASGLEFFMGLAIVVAVVSCLAFSLWSVILLLGGFGPSKQQRQDLANAYIDAMRYIRYRILWFQETYEIDAVPSYLAEAEKALLSQVKNVQDVLRRELGKDWLVPMGTICVDNIEGLMGFMETFQFAEWSKYMNMGAIFKSDQSLDKKT